LFDWFWSDWGKIKPRHCSRGHALVACLPSLLLPTLWRGPPVSLPHIPSSDSRPRRSQATADRRSGPGPPPPPATSRRAHPPFPRVAAVGPPSFLPCAAAPAIKAHRLRWTPFFPSHRVAAPSPSSPPPPPPRCLREPLGPPLTDGRLPPSTERHRLPPPPPTHQGPTAWDRT
jgi:hypothetical protein